MKFKSPMFGMLVAMAAVALMHSPASAGDCRGVLQLQAQAVYAQPVQVQYAAPIQFHQSAYLAPQNIQFQTAYTAPATQFRVVKFQQSSHHAQQQRSRSRQPAKFVAPPQQAIVLRQEVPVQRGRNTQIGFINFGR